MLPLRNPKHERFAQAIAEGQTLEAAHRAAGYAPDRRNAQKLRVRPDIAQRINDILTTMDRVEERAVERAIERTAITKEKVINELAKIGFANMADYTRQVGPERVIDLTNATRDQLAAVQEITVEDFKDGRGLAARDVRRVKLKLADKKGALVDIGREIGMFVQRTEVGKPGEFANMSDAAIREEIGRRLEARGMSKADVARFMAARRGVAAELDEAPPAPDDAVN